ncbi:phasin family protein [Paraburkholderia sp. BL6669N2]|uniref:phasin family protein n=1 Tax=Paraburkholderia sp. BL6669N2 TaxID=1938807 RepID=UPI000E397E18|nr:phasin family protein [Paraburkholderia sp. BL6669N2]REG60773.1 phasin family protein [Paraburkholderia sp. BL6669N2]
MSSLSVQPMVALQRASLETLSDVWTKAFGCIEKLTELNVRAVKSTLAENQAIADLALSTKDPQELFALQARRAQAAMQEAQSYWRHVSTIVYGTQAELAASAEAQLKQQQQKTQALVDTVATNASAGSEAAVSVMQSAVTAGSEATDGTIEAGKKAAEQAPEIAEDYIEAATSATNKATQQAVEQVKTARKR